MKRGVGVTVPLLLLLAHSSSSSSSSSSNFAAAVGDQEIMEAAEECFPGYTILRGECVKEVARKQLQRCPPKASFQDGQCVFERVTKASLVCGASQRLSGDRCEFEELLVAESACPRGFVFDGRGCMRSQESPGMVSCPLGFVLTPGAPQSCQRETRSRPKTLCPPGAEPLGPGRCRQRDVAQPQQQCALGFSLDPSSGGCLRLELQRPELRCHQGQRLEEGFCRSSRRVAAHAACPPDHLFDGRDCLRVELAPPTPSCPKGYSFGEGGSRCVRVQEREPSLLCGAGFELADGQCSRRSSARPLSRCPDGAAASVVLGRTLCELIEAAPAALGCAADFDLVGGGERCEKRTAARAAVSCPLGFQPAADGCSREQLVRPNDLCPAGSTLKDGFCVALEAVAATPACDAEGALTPQGTCVRLFTAQLQHSCPHGYRLSGSSCSRTTHAPAAAVCAPHMRMRGAECVSTESQPAVPSCDLGFEPDPRGFCIKLDVRAPKKTCPKTHKLFNHYCVRKADKTLIF